MKRKPKQKPLYVYGLEDRKTGYFYGSRDTGVPWTYQSERLASSHRVTGERIVKFKLVRVGR